MDPTIAQEASHSTLVMWTVAFFFTGMALYATLFWYSVRGLKASVTKMSIDVSGARKEIGELDKRKVELVLYLDDKEKAEAIIKTLQTTERCTMMQSICIASIRPQPSQISEAIESVLENQKGLIALQSSLDLVRDRQVQVIERIDRHLNGHPH